MFIGRKSLNKPHAQPIFFRKFLEIYYITQFGLELKEKKQFILQGRIEGQNAEPL